MRIALLRLPHPEQTSTSRLTGLYGMDTVCGWMVGGESAEIHKIDQMQSGDKIIVFFRKLQLGQE